jgi:hypothetical protein
MTRSRRQQSARRDAAAPEWSGHAGEALPAVPQQLPLSIRR